MRRVFRIVTFLAKILSRFSSFSQQNVFSSLYLTSFLFSRLLEHRVNLRETHNHIFLFEVTINKCIEHTSVVTAYDPSVGQKFAHKSDWKSVGTTRGSKIISIDLGCHNQIKILLT